MATKKSRTRAIGAVGDLVLDPKNARLHGARNEAAIEASLREVGAARSIVIDERGTVLAGNATVKAARKVGLSKLMVVDADGATVVAVRLTGLTARDKARLALHDNRTAELAEGWDPQVLEELLGAGVRLDDLWTADELVELLGGAVSKGLTNPDAVPAPRATSIASGQLFALGPHRLLCGDSTNSKNVDAVLGGGPPFAHGH